MLSYIETLRDLKSLPRVFIYSTGAGAGIQKRLWEIPGCSSFLVGCGFPYDSNLTAEYLGFTPDKFVSVDTAINLAMAAYIKAYKPGHYNIGIGLTASVASTTEHRGTHRIIVSSFSNDECLTFSAEIPKRCGIDQRMTDGHLSDEIALRSLYRASKISMNEVDIHFYHNDNIMKLKFSPTDTLTYSQELLLKYPYFLMDGIRASEDKIETDKVIFYPGSFNPFHFGHAMGAEAIRQEAAKRFGECREIVFTTVVNPPHKTALSVSEMLNRSSLMRNKNFCLTVNDPLFIDKARRRPNSWFGLGADALLTMLDPKWGISTSDLLFEFYKLNNKMFVLGRLVNGSYVTLADIKNKYPILNNYEHLFIDVPGRWDISSTELRNK